MYLKSLSVKNFRKFKEFSVKFPSDITIVKGPNEQGKSTILLAILAGLFYDPKKTNKDIDALKAWSSEDLYEIGLEMENDGNEISLNKDFKNKEMLLENKTTGEKLNTFKEISDYLFNIGTLRSPSLFESTACVKHDALSLITQGGREISQALQSILTSSSENVSPDRIVKKINDALTGIQKGLKQAAKTPGVLKEIDDEVVALEQRKSKIASELEDIAKKVDYLGSIQSEFNDLKKEFETKLSQYEMNKKYFQIISELDRLNSQFKKINGDVEAIEKLEKSKEYIMFQLEKMSSLEGFDLKDFYNKISSLKQKEAKLEYVKKSSLSAVGAKKKGGRGALFLNIALVFFALGFLGFLNALAFASFAVSLIFFILSFSRRGDEEVKESQKPSSEAAMLEKALKNEKDEINAVFEKNNIKNEEELVAKIKEYNEFCKELEKTESKKDGILRGASFDDLKAERSALLKKIGIEEEKITDEQKTNVPTPQEQRLLEIDLEREGKKLDSLEKEILQVSAVSNQYNMDREEMIKIEEEVEYLKEKRKNTERKVKVLEALLANIKEAQTRITSRSKSRIEDYMKKYIAVITDGRYDNVIVNDDLSFGFYLVARFAILDLLNRGKKSLVLLDDQFHSFDAQRRENTKQVLNDLTNKFQIILFTHSSDFDDFGEAVSI
ncbi:AAA family ATPase [Candidatus Azambacteria bacterium]|nr:AAA family ATPase [Candidatus Azambacteria bacterium]